MKDIKDYIYPNLVYTSIKEALVELNHLNRYKGILKELEEEGKLEALKIKLEGDKLFIGVNLNPELLMYTEDSQESVELKFVSDAMKKYTDFLQNEGILDVIKADYERVYNEEHYGYVVQISYDFKKYSKSKYRYDIGYVSVAALATIGIISSIVVSFL